MSGLELLARAVVAMVLAFVAVALLRRTALGLLLSDRPNERSLHERPTPRLGGLGMVVAVAAVVAPATSGPVGAVLLCALALVVVSLVDDARALPVPVRLTAHLAAAGVAAWILWPGAPAWVIALLALAIAWMGNLYNFMDGSDGLAGGMGAIGFAAHAVAAQAFGAEGLALACAALAGASTGFLGQNFPPARVFMGDAGSVPLGFLAAALGALGAVEGAWPAWFPVLVFSPFILDASVTLLRRAAARERLWAAHRSHYYQRLVLAGWSKRRLALSMFGLMALASASALAARREVFLLQCGTLLVWAAIYVLLLVAIDRFAPRLGAQGSRGSVTPR